MTRGGRIWFAVQFLIFLAMLAAPVVQRVDVAVLIRVAGFTLAVGGAVLSVAGYRALGGSHSPGTTPISDGEFVRSGIYLRLRHPIYAGWCLGAFGFALIFGSPLGVGVAAALVVYYDLRSRTEERYMLQRYPDYASYMRSVRRFVPGLY